MNNEYAPAFRGRSEITEQKKLPQAVAELSSSKAIGSNVAVGVSRS